VQDAISTKVAEAVLTQGTKCKELRRFPVEQKGVSSCDQALMNERRKMSEFAQHTQSEPPQSHKKVTRPG